MVELLVTLLIVASLVATMFPILVNQGGRVDPVRLATELASLRSGLQLFRMDVRAGYPSDLEDLANRISGVDRSIEGRGYDGAATARWSGPYIEASFAEVAAARFTGRDAIRTGFDATIPVPLIAYDADANRPLVPGETAGADYVAVMILGLDRRQFEEVNDLLDGTAEPDGFDGCVDCSSGRGSLRRDPATGIVYFLAVPYP